MSDATRCDYKARIWQYTNFVKQEGLFDNDSFLNFKRYLSSRNDYSTSTKNKYLATARIFLKELNRLGLTPNDITINVKSFQQTKKHKRSGFNETQVATIMFALKNMASTPQNERLKALLTLLVFQGLRQVEIVRLNVKDIDFEGSVAMIRGKGCDDLEPIDLHPETVLALRNYLSKNKLADGPLFISNSNNGRGQRLTTKSLREIVGKFVKSLLIEGKTVHGFRHFFTTTLIKEFGGNLLDVMSYTRHKSVEMLVVYNDRIRKSEDLPKYYNAFSSLT